MSQSTQDIRYGWNGDSTTLNSNFIREGLFGGNDERYGIVSSLVGAIGLFEGFIKYLMLAGTSALIPGRGTQGNANSNSQSPMFGTDWYRNFNETYGSDKVKWESVSIQDIIDMPSRITDFSPQQIINLAQANGWSVEPLGKGSLEGVPYEQGGGFSIHSPNGGSEYIQYHPAGGHHEELPYFKVSSGPNGTVRFFMGGNGQ